MFKKNYPIQIILILPIILISCSLQTITISTKKPIEINIPQYANSLLLVNKTYQKAFWMVVNSIGNDKMLYYDKQESVSEVMNSFEGIVKQSPRFTIKHADEHMTSRNFRAFFSRKISWDTIQHLCNKYDVNVVIAVEVFQSSFKKNKRDSVISPATQNKPAETISLYEAQSEVAVGFRIYDPKNKSIIDSEVFTEKKSIRVGEDEFKRMGNEYKTIMIHGLCRKAGLNYASKIVSIPTNQNRSIYKKGKKSKNVSEGLTKAISGDWEEAKNIWEAGLSNATPEDASRLCYNIAISYENNGDIENAKQWAIRSNKEHDNFVSRNYLKQLNLILIENPIIKENSNN